MTTRARMAALVAAIRMTVHEARKRLSHALADAGIDHEADFAPAGRVRVRIRDGLQLCRAGSDAKANAVRLTLRGMPGVVMLRTYVLEPAHAVRFADSLS